MATNPYLEERSMTTKNPHLGEPDETGARTITMEVGKLVPLSLQEMDKYNYLKRIKNLVRVEIVAIYKADGELVPTSLIIAYPQTGECRLIDTIREIPLAYGENAVRIAFTGLQQQDEEIEKAAKDYIKKQNAATHSLEALDKTMKHAFLK